MTRHAPGAGTWCIVEILISVVALIFALLLTNVPIMVMGAIRHRGFSVGVHLIGCGAAVALVLTLATLRYATIDSRYGGKVVFQDHVHIRQSADRRSTWRRLRRLLKASNNNLSTDSQQHSIQSPQESPRWELSTLQSAIGDTLPNADQRTNQKWLAHGKPTFPQTCETYHYAELSDTELRLLHIQHTDDESHPLEAIMIRLPLLSARENGFTALSYTWGRDDTTSKIYIEGQCMDIRPGLANILRALRSARCGLLWVDAICINQNDIQERNLQVLRMRGIFAGAHNTVVAINLPDDERSDIVGLLAKTQPDLRTENQDRALADLLRQPKTKQALKHYFQAEYWKRIWIVQEFAIGRRIDLLLGEILINARNLAKLLEYAENMAGISIEGAEQVSKILDIRRSWQAGQPTDLFRVLEMTQGSLCERRHDRVFGLLGLIFDTLDFFSEPSYQIDPIYLAPSMTRSYIERRSLDIIILAERIDANCSLQLPSWCPPFFWYDQYPPSRHTIDLALGHRQVRSDPRARSWSATGNSHNSCTFGGAALVSPARRIGSIKSLGSAWTDKDDTQFPCYDHDWAEMRRYSCRGSYVGDSMVNAILDREYEYKTYEYEPFRARPMLLLQEKHYYVEIFRSIYGQDDAEDFQTDLQRWIRSNRKFSVGGKTLEEHAERCRRTPLVFVLAADIKFSYRSFEEMAKRDMRMTCLDDDQYGIGWAAKGARLYDEVFLIPGCSVPLILRRVEGTEKYNLIGDAIVIGIMEGELWDETRAEDLVQVKIV